MLLLKRDLLNGKMPDTDLVLVKELKANNGSKIGHITLNSEETLNSLTCLLYTSPSPRDRG